MFTKTLLGSAAVAGLALAAPATALADGHGPQAEAFHVVCDNGATFDVTSPAVRSVVGQAVASHMNLVLAGRGVPSDMVLTCNAYLASTGQYAFTLPLLLTPANK